MRKATKGWTTKTVDELFDVQLGKMLNEIAKGGDGRKRPKVDLLARR